MVLHLLYNTPLYCGCETFYRSIYYSCQQPGFSSSFVVHNYIILADDL